MARAASLKGSGDFDGQRGVWRVLVLEADDQSEAYDVAAAEAPDPYLEVPRGAASVKEEGGGVYLVEFEYLVRNAGTDPQTPQGETPGAGNVSPPERAAEKVGTDLSFSFGGKTTRIFTSLETKFGVGRTVNGQAQRAPSFLNLIGYNPKDGTVEGCEVYAKGCSFTITKKYAGLNYGYLARLFGNTATTNDKPFRGMATGECLYIGCDGSYKGGGGENLPWEIAGKFEYSPNQTTELKIGSTTDFIKIPAGTINGHDYLWLINEDTTDQVPGEPPFAVARPKFAYVERVYEKSKFEQLGMDT